MKNFNSGVAFLNQIDNLKIIRKRLLLIAKTINRLNDLTLPQYAQLFAITTEYKPDLIIELGRGYGNSTAVLTEVINHLGKGRVISICLSNDWQENISKKLAKVLPPNWFSSLDARIQNILDVNFKSLVRTHQRILFFWDAHGWDVAEYVLSMVVHALRNKEHLILVHDISSFKQGMNGDYGPKGIWKGYPGDEVKDPPYVVVNSMISPFEEVIAINDFASRNQLKVNSVQEEINEAFKKNSHAAIRAKKLLGGELSSSSSSIHWFSLNTLPKTQKIFYPKFKKKKEIVKPEFDILFSRQKNYFASSFKDSRPLVSIVTPSFNHGKFIEECIQSVLNQDYPSVEHIIQDGESTDRTLKILKKYSIHKYKDRIKLVFEPDKGQSDGLDKALKRVNGNVILVLNADDVLLPYACSWGVLHLKMNPDVAVVYGDEYIIDENGKIIREFTGHSYNYEKLLCVEIVPAAQTAFIRKSYFEQVGLGADSTLPTCPDYEMWVRIGARFPMKYVPGFVSKYRWHKESEGQKPEIILKMIAAKKQVMDRVFNAPKTPRKIKGLRKRAYAGVGMWGAINNMQLRGPVLTTGKYVISSFLNYPPNIWRYRKLIPGGILSFSRFAIKTYAKKLLS